MKSWFKQYTNIEIMALKKYNLTYYPEMMLKYAGLHPYLKSKILIFYHYYTNCFFFVFLSILSILNVVLVPNVFKKIEGLSSVLFMTYTFCRYVINHYNKPHLAQLLKAQSKFWKIENFDDQIRTECDYLMTRAANFIRFYKNYALILASVFYVQPFIFHELQMKIYVPDGWFYFLYFVYWYMTPPLFVSVYGVTSMFCALCVPVVIQFKLLAHKIKYLEMNGNNHKLREQMKKLIDHHNFLIKYCQNINSYSNAVLLFEFFITVSVCCILIFMATNDYPLTDKIKYTGFIVSQFLDTAVYCYNADLISETSLAVGDAAYGSLWFKCDDIVLNKNFMLIIMRSQQKVIFSGYKLIGIDMMTFTKVFKVTLSFVSFLNTATITKKEN